MLLEIGNRIKNLRKYKGLTQEQLALDLHIERATLSSYENGIRSPAYDTLAKIAQYFEITTDYLLGLEPMGVAGYSGLTKEQQHAIQVLIYQCKLANSIKDKPDKS